MSLYYEIHVTIAPEFDRIEQAKALAWPFGYHMGDLLLMKRDDERSHKDMFFTARTSTRDEAVESVTNFVLALHDYDFTVLRYKIEDTIRDSRISDDLGLLNPAILDNMIQPNKNRGETTT